MKSDRRQSEASRSSWRGPLVPVRMLCVRVSYRVGLPGLWRRETCLCASRAWVFHFERGIVIAGPGDDDYGAAGLLWFMHGSNGSLRSHPQPVFPEW